MDCYKIIAVPKIAAEADPIRDGFGRPIDQPHVVISITDPGGYDAEIKPNNLRKAILRVQFDDADTDRDVMILMSPDQAKDIVEFGTKYQDDLIVVHCTAGVCRSPAIAAALCKILDRDNSRFFRQYRPNAYVYKMILEHHFGKTSYG